MSFALIIGDFNALLARYLCIPLVNPFNEDNVKHSLITLSTRLSTLKKSLERETVYTWYFVLTRNDGWYLVQRIKMLILFHLRFNGYFLSYHPKWTFCHIIIPSITLLDDVTNGFLESEIPRVIMNEQ